MQPLPDTYPGARYCKVMQASVDAVLGPMGIRRRVISQGSRFMNVDAWTAEAFAHALCDHFATSPSSLPNREQLHRILVKANDTRVEDPRILVAQMPSRTTQKTVRAIIGGGYHEAWHTKYSKRTPVTVAEAHSVLDVAREILRTGGIFDAKTRGFMLTLHHLVEDIRIERRGNEDFPGAMQAMEDLQDFILELEAAGRDSRDGKINRNARSILLCCFRDLGLGYNTELARRTIETYKATAPKAIALLASDGLLEPMLVEAQGLAREDQVGSLRVALHVLLALYQASPRRRDPSSDDDVCPQCGASAEHLQTVAARDESEDRVRVVCDQCGHTNDVEPLDTSLDLLGDGDTTGDAGVGPSRPDSDGFGDDDRERLRDLRLRGEPQKPVDLKVLWEILDDVSGGVLTSADVVDALTQGAAAQELRELKSGERRWCPYCPSDDVAELARGTGGSDVVSKMLQDLAPEISFLRSRFRTLFLAQEMTDVVHGTRRGRRLSDRTLTDTRIDVASFVVPTRAYVDVDMKTDTSLAMAVCLDQSGSMSPIRLEVAKCALLLVEPLDRVGAATMVFGFEDRGVVSTTPVPVGISSEDYHRCKAVHYDVFKTWDEKVDNARARFNNVKASGGTPMADGVQFGLTALNDRPETHRILAVVTDGHPDRPHEQVIRRQLRIARDANIHVLGIGIGHSAAYVSALFPDHVWASSVGELPLPLMHKLQALCDFSHRLRRRSARLDGPIFGR